MVHLQIKVEIKVFNNNLTNTKSNLITDRDKNSQNLTQQNLISNNNYNIFNKTYK